MSEVAFQTEPDHSSDSPFLQRCGRSRSMGRFRKIDKAVNRFGYWVGAYTILSGVFAWIAAKMDRFHVNWAEAVFLGVLATGFVVLFLSIGLIAWRYFQPIKNPARPLFDYPENERDVSLETKLNEFLATKLRAEFTTHAQTHAYDEKLSSLAGEVRSLKASVEGLGNLLGVRHRELKDRVGEIARGCAALEEKVTAAHKQAQEHLERRLENVDQAFAALRNREWHQRLFRELGEEMEAIAKPIEEGNGIADDAVWKRQVKAWRAKLDQWLVIANYYAGGATENVLVIPEHLYEGDWSFDEKPLTANQIHRFKEVAIWWHNAGEQQERVERVLASTAFDIPSKKGRVDGPPRLTDVQ